MANNVYIGNRYVPVFANPVEWDNLRQYEPLTIVTYQGTAYTSKKTVPVGTALSNTEYWVVTGNYNAQVEQYRQEVANLASDVSAIDGRVDTIEDCDIHSLWHGKKVCIYGDSLSDYAGDTYWERLIARDPSIQITNRAVGGTTIDQGRAAINSATDLATYDIIVIAFGTNEWQSSWGYDSIKNRFVATFDILKNKIASNPSEKVVVITPFYSYRNYGGVGTQCNKAGLTIDMVNDAIAEVANQYGYPVLNFFFSSSCNSSNYTSRLENSSGIYVHEIGAFSEELSYIVERWDGQSYIARPFILGENSISPIEFVTYTKRLTKANYETIPDGYRDGICMKMQGGASTASLYRYLSKDEEYNIRLYGDNIVAISIKNSGGTTVWSQVSNASTEFKAKVTVSASGYYKIQLNTDPNVSETIIGGLYFGRADGGKIPQMWHACTVQNGSGTCSYKLDGDTIALSSQAITNMTSGSIILFPELTGIPDTFVPITGASATSPTMTIAIISNNGLNVLKGDIGTVYMCSVVAKVKCYNFDI